MIGRRNNYRVDALFLIEHFSIILIAVSFGRSLTESRSSRITSRKIYITKCGNMMTSTHQMLNMPLHSAPHANKRNGQLLVGFSGA